MRAAQIAWGELQAGDRIGAGNFSRVVRATCAPPPPQHTNTFLPLARPVCVQRGVCSVYVERPSSSFLIWEDIRPLM